MTNRALAITLLAGACSLLAFGVPAAIGDSKQGGLCSPSCYEPEPPSPDAGKETKACTHYTKGFCETATVAGWGEPVLNQGATFVEIVASCKFPAPKPGKWAALSKRAVKDLEPKASDVAFIPGDSDWEAADSSDGSKLRCLDLHWYEKNDSVTMTKCGHPDEKVVCEVTGSKSVRAINVMHFRIDEATKLKATDKKGCQAAALQAIAFSRGLPKFKKALGDDWAGGLTYKTRYDGVLNEKALFAKVKKLGDQATALYKQCGGTKPTTTDEDEMAFKQQP
jgi:hypothetical protein